MISFFNLIIIPIFYLEIFKCVTSPYDKEWKYVNSPSYYSHQSGEVAMASFYRMDSESSHLPSMLSALEQQNFLFQLQLSDQAQDDSNEVRAENNDDGALIR